MFDNIINESDTYIMMARDDDEATVAYGIDWASGDSTFTVIVLHDVFLNRSKSF